MIFMDTKNCGFQIVVCNPGRYSSEKVKSSIMRIQKDFLFLKRKGFHKPHTGIVQPHHKKLLLDFDPRHDHHRFSLICLGILPASNYKGR